MRRRHYFGCFRFIYFSFVYFTVQGVANVACAATLESTPEYGSTIGLSAATLAVVVNESDHDSVEVAAYYQMLRKIPERNVIRVRIAPGRDTLTAAEFAQLYAEVHRKTPLHVQGYALAWTQPYRIDCMSITTAFAMGVFDPGFCTRDCAPTRSSAYFNSDTRIPMDRFGIRPTMLIAASSVQQAKSLIDRGISADRSFTQGTAYLLRTDDSRRNVRSELYEQTKNLIRAPLQASVVVANGLRDRNDVMFYFIGARSVAAITSNTFLPGAIADHLTSTGGDILHTRQMSSLRWIDAGATGSYGSVTEPCAMLEKFPNPAVAIKYYQQGETLLEAYWKSVAMPGQGLFIGEPLARPFAARPFASRRPELKSSSR
jgi:uncharacterized protein (TIGR03790 family)